MRPYTRIATACAALLLPCSLDGCGGDDPEVNACDPSEARAGFRFKHDNSSTMNGLSIREQFPNGLLTTTALLAGEMVNGVTLVESYGADGQPIVAVALDDMSKGLRYQTAGGPAWLGGPDAFPIAFTYERDDGTRAEIRIERAVNLGKEAYVGGLLDHYETSYRLYTDGAWGEFQSDLCADGEGEPVEALLVLGVWDPVTASNDMSDAQAITLGCRNAALVKCVEWAYRFQTGPMAWVHEACTRMVRADYNGDGTSYTKNGTRIYVGDSLPLVMQQSHPGWLVKEAEWGQQGASCINRSALRQLALTGCESDPDCFAGIPECENPDDLTPSDPGLLMTAISLTAFGTSDYLYGAQYLDDVGASMIYMAAQDGSDFEEVGLATIPGLDGAATERVEIDGVLQTDFEGPMGFQIDRENNRSRPAILFGNGAVMPTGPWMEGRVIRGAAISDHNGRRLVYAIASKTDELCRLWAYSGYEAETEGGCVPLPIDVGDDVDLVQSGEGTLTIVDGGNVWTMDLDTLDMTQVGSFERSFVGVARPGDGSELVAADALHSELVRLRMPDETCQGGSLEVIGTIPAGAVGDLAGSAP